MEDKEVFCLLLLLACDLARPVAPSMNEETRQVEPYGAALSEFGGSAFLGSAESKSGSRDSGDPVCSCRSCEWPVQAQVSIHWEADPRSNHTESPKQIGRRVAR